MEAFMNDVSRGCRRVVIGICTYKRSDKLVRLLQLLRPQVLAMDDWHVRIVVVDNDSSKSAEAAVAQYSGAFNRGQLEYVTEPAPGVGNARNAIFDVVVEGEVLVLFDDDQEPAPNWLAEMLSKHMQSPNEVLVGPVVPVLPDEVPAWALDAGMWGRRQLPDGAIQQYAGFGNILVPEKVLQSGLCRVPSDFLHGPGEDTLITSRVTAAGFIIRHVAAASAVEYVTPDRMSVEWLSRRAETSGETWVRVVRSTGGSEIRLALSTTRVALSLIAASIGHCFIKSPKSKVQLEVARGRLRGYARALFSKPAG
ncbi:MULTISPECIES: glycosyltransferase [Micrococcaceae]|uniref:glycosyltransferase n=1 Tax=Micrococcaceae TaxID=1268 RepID=UPI002D78B6D0|nr:glycosyltransferase [Pseudarthrobacter sp. LT1]WRT13041.1 glycosyltransferase [Pseudarthrobacter sp. LT1]